MELSLLGSVDAHRDAQLSTTRGGYVEQVAVRAGDRVSRGSVLARVDSELHRVLLEQATAQKELADAEHKRALGLGDLISEAQLQASETQLQIAQAGLRQAELNLERSVVKAPFSGQVGEVHVEPGEVVGPGMPVMRLVALNKVLVRLNVADRDVVSLEKGMEARVFLQAVASVFAGKVSSIAPVADSDTRAFQVEVEVQNSDRKLLPGMIARVELGREMPAETILIPQDWVVTGLQEQGVYVVEDGKAVWRPLELGDVVRDQVLVFSGVGPGDRVVVSGHRALNDGDLVLVGREGQCCESGRASF
jgi:membrane fusion protein (multidrug efflux system)